MDIKNEVLYRVYIVLFLVIIAAVAIAVKTVQISVVQGADWRKKLDSLYVKSIPVEAPRGNILTADGSFLATSLPSFDIRMDLMTIDTVVFEKHLDSLAHCLATFVDNTYTVGGYRAFLAEQRAQGQRYLLIKRNATFAEMQMMSEFPIFKLGRFQGGFIAEPAHDRLHPFKQLAYRTIGYTKGDRKIGLEGFFDDVLAGEAGRRLVFRAPGNVWIPLISYSHIEPERGKDIVTTIDVNIQDITHKALLRALNSHDAESGTAIVMDVKSGEIKAISNLGRIDNGWYEIYNYAVGSAYEPGSTFKIASVMALLEDGLVDLTDSVFLNKGRATFYEEEMVDAVYHEFDSASLQQAFEISSNVGIATLVQKHYGDEAKADQFIKRLRQFNLHLPTDIEIEGEAPPYLKEAYNQNEQWSGITLPWMSIGYEVLLTPLQLLTFVNAIANDGMMVKPLLVKEIQNQGETEKAFKPTVIKKSIASRATIQKVQQLLSGVVERGTAKKLKTDLYSFAGKTGTAQINYKKFKGTKSIRYRASFAGYFPADNPRYTCMVVITDPKKNGRYGGEVAGPVFREIADHCFYSHIDMHPAMNDTAKPVLTGIKLPKEAVGFRNEMVYLLKHLNLNYDVIPSTTYWTSLGEQQDTLTLNNRPIIKGKVPNVTGMGLRDALFILENLGLEVIVRGNEGKVIRQSLRVGTDVKGQKITITLG